MCFPALQGQGGRRKRGRKRGKEREQNMGRRQGGKEGKREREGRNGERIKRAE